MSIEYEWRRREVGVSVGKKRKMVAETERKDEMIEKKKKRVE